MKSQTIHFVTGKGGVGKSSFALALSLHFAQQGKKVLLAELGSHSFYKDLLNIKVGYEPTFYSNNLSICLWSGKDCLKEYALHLLKLESLYHLFFENKISKSLIDIAPSLSELSILGKITSGLRKVGPPLDFDIIVVDAYATGHMLSLLRAPRGMNLAIPLGPMGEQTKSILNIIRNQNTSRYWIVTQPEELPVVETLDLYSDLKTETQIEPFVVFNKMLPAALIQNLRGETTEEVDFIQRLQKRISKELELKKRIEQISNHLPLIEIPSFYEENEVELIHEIQKVLSDSGVNS